MSVDINIAFKMLTSFDGDKNRLYEFCNNCDTALELLTTETDKKILFSIIQTKITGKARVQIRNRAFANWHLLKTYLNDTYSDKRSHGQWQLELSSCRQGSDEDVLSYSQKVENCLLKLTSSLDETLTASDRAACVKLLRNQALNVFISGLKKDLAIIVKSQKPERFEDAVQYAIAEEIEQKSSKEIGKFQYIHMRQSKFCNYCKKSGHLESHCRYKTEPNRFNINYINKSQNRFNQQNRITKYCNYCRRSGHSDSECRSRANVRNVNTNDIARVKTNIQNSGQNQTKICNYCKNLGHLIHECKKREFNNNLKKQGTFRSNSDRNFQTNGKLDQQSNSSSTVRNLNSDHSSVAAEPKKLTLLKADN